MCGVTGYWSPGQQLQAEAMRDTGRRMAGAIRHRGPDDEGVWTGGDGVCLAHRRLAVIDVSPGGHQPMQSHDGRRVMVFNGEIYNFQELRAELEAQGVRGWRGHSDTEVLLEAVSRWGMARALAKANGMFAFALWDGEERTLSLARDRFGEKPLFYGFAGNSLLFGSELKAMQAHPQWRGTLDMQAVAQFLRFSYVPAPHSIFDGIVKLMPGCWIQFRARDITQQRMPPVSRYWSARTVAVAGMSSPASGSDEELVAETERRMQDAVGARMLADVPLGAFLSGGIDSSLVVALMQQQSARPVQTFSIGFHDPRYDEASSAAQVARHLGTRHAELYVSERDITDTVELLPSLYDEPFGDSSQIPTFLVSKLARASVTVALSGDGGDELFGGYNRHTWVPRIWNVARLLPAPLRRQLAAVVTRSSSEQLERWTSLQRFLPGPLQVRAPADKLKKLARIIGAQGPGEIYAGLVSSGANPAALLRSGSSIGYSIGSPPSGNPGVQDGEMGTMALAPWMMLNDALTYLPDDILTKVDRASMGVSLESRIPFLDPGLFAWAWQLPQSLKIRDGVGKWVLRQVLYRHVPQALIDRPKTGFGLPVDVLIRGPLKEWTTELLERRRLRAHGVLDADAVSVLFERVLAGRSAEAALLWNVLVLTQWIDASRGRIGIAHDSRQDALLAGTEMTVPRLAAG